MREIRTRFIGEIMTTIDTNIDINTMLFLRYKLPIVSLEIIVADYLPHMNINTANKKAARCNLPFPAFKIDGGKGKYFVNISDVAKWLDKLQKEAKSDWQNMQLN